MKKKQKKIVIPAISRVEQLKKIVHSSRGPVIKYSGYGAMKTDKHPSRARRKALERREKYV